MASESYFTDFGDSFIDAIAADLYVGLHPLYNPEFFTFAGEPLSHDIFGPPLSPQALPLSTDESLFSGIPPDAPPTQGVMQNVLHPLQISNEASILYPRTIATPLHNALSTASHNGIIGAGLWFTDFAQPSSGRLPAFSLPRSPPAPAFPPNWIRVPQRGYDYGRKQWNFERSEPISFSVNGRPGINMGDALRKSFAELDGRDDPVLQDAQGAISCRLLFPGYPANGSSSQKIHALDWTKNRLPITRSKLAYEIAKKLERYLNYIARFALDGSVENRWRVGEGFMHINNMYLVRLVSVSKGSFQPEIWVEDPSVPQTFANWK